MAADYDPNIELNPTPILAIMTIFVVLGFGVVFMIVTMDDTKAVDASAVPGQ